MVPWLCGIDRCTATPGHHCGSHRTAPCPQNVLLQLIPTPQLLVLFSLHSFALYGRSQSWAWWPLLFIIE